MQARNVEAVDAMRLGRLILGLLALAAHPAAPRAEALATGNGHGFAVFDSEFNAIRQYLERPYRYLRANPQNPDGEGIARRDLAFDTYWGVRVDTTTEWLGNRKAVELGYVAESNVIRSAVTVNGVVTESFFVSPFGYDGNALVMLLKVTNSSPSPRQVTAFSIHNFKLGAAINPDEPGDGGESIAFDAASATASEVGPGGGAMIYAPIGGVDASSCADDAFTTIANGGELVALARCDGSDKKNAFARRLGTVAPGSSQWWGVAILFDAAGDIAGARTRWAAFAAGRTADQIYNDTLAEWEGWRVTPPSGLTANELATWRQSEAVLRMAQVRESYQELPRRKNLGMILASLPPGAWHITWVRDAVYATVALARTGHTAEAKASLDFFLAADAGRFHSYVRDVDYRISTVRYFGDGEEEADFSGAPTRNIELDGWGLYLWAARSYVDAAGDGGWLAERTRKGDVVYDAIAGGVAEPLIANLEASGIAAADASIWEVHYGNREHFLYTTAAAARGLCDMAALARYAGRSDDVARYRALHDQAVAAIATQFVDRDHVLAGSLERLASGADYRDGSSLEALMWSLVAIDNPIARATLDSMARLETVVGGYQRREGSQDPYDTNEWAWIDMRASAAFRRAGNHSRADQLLGWVTDQAAGHFHLVPELYNTRSQDGPLGAYSGAVPMVGYGAGTYQLTLLDRSAASLAGEGDCGDHDLGEPPPEPTGDSGGTGCGCRTGSARGVGGGAPLAIALALAVRGRRRRGG